MVNLSAIGLFSIALLFHLAQGQIHISSHTCVGLEGGVTTLYGSGFNTERHFSVKLSLGTSSVDCTRAAVVSHDMAICTVPPTSNPSARGIVVNNRSVATFVYCSPLISSISIGSLSGENISVIVTGKNFGRESSLISLRFQRKSDFTPFTCTNIQTSTNDAFTCFLSVNPANTGGQYYASLWVDGQASPFNGVSSLTVGQCYSKPLISSDSIVSLLTQRSLERNVQKLKTLVDDLRAVRSLLPKMEDNDCGVGSSFQSPVPGFELAFMSSDSFEFKDCVDAFCSQREQFLSDLVSFNHLLEQSFP